MMFRIVHTIPIEVTYRMQPICWEACDVDGVDQSKRGLGLNAILMETPKLRLRFLVNISQTN